MTKRKPGSTRRLGRSPWWTSVLFGVGDLGCWEWTAAKAGQGYGYFWKDGGLRRIHRVVYEELRGPIPSGLDLDHTCRNRACCNPAHLEPVTRTVNLRRGAGHGGMLKVVV